MSSPFPLLGLPRLVLCEVFKSLSIGEKIKLSICSKKISTQINNCRLYSQRVIVGLDILNRNIEVHCENRKDIFEISNCYENGQSNKPYIRRYRIEGCTVPVISSRTRITIFWNNHREGLLSVIRHLLKIFRCKFSTDSSYSNTVQLQPIIAMLFDLQLEFKKLSMLVNGSKGQNLLFNQISNKFGLVEDLKITYFGYPSFTPVFTSWPQKIDIINSAWFTLEYLLGCTCTTITLWGSYLKNKDLDEILINWKTGGFPNLKCLKISSQKIKNDGTKIVGMNWRELSGTVIQTDDGSKQATIKIGLLILNSHWIEMSVTPFE